MQHLFVCLFFFSFIYSYILALAISIVSLVWFCFFFRGFPSVCVLGIIQEFVAMLYVHGVENGNNDCATENSVNKNFVPNSISSLILTHNQSAVFHHHTQIGDGVQPSMNNNGHWMGGVGNANTLDNNSELTANEVKHHFGGGNNDLSIYTRDAFGGQKESDNVRSFSVNKLLQITNRSGSDSACGM